MGCLASCCACLLPCCLKQFPEPRPGAPLRVQRGGREPVPPRRRLELPEFDGAAISYAVLEPEASQAAGAAPAAPAAAAAAKDGEGRWVVCVHGLSGSMYQFEALGLALARRGYRVLLYDAFGRGESDLPFVPGGHSVEFYVGLLARVVNFVLGPDARFALLGFSMGGAVAVEFAARHAARVSHLVLAGPAGYIQRSDLACAQCCPLVPRWMAMRQGIKLLADNPRQDVSRPDLHRELTELACERHNDSLDRNPGRLAAFVYSLSQFPFGGVEPSARRAGELLDRVLLLWGDLDGQDGKGVDFSGLKQYRQAMPRAEVRVFPGVAHAIYIEDPAGLEDAVATFLAK